MKTRVVLLSLLAIFSAAVAPAQTNFFWVGTTPNLNTNWSIAAAWTNETGSSAAPVAGGSNAYVIVFGTNATYFTRLNNALNTNFHLNSMIFNAGAVTILGSRGTGLVFVANAGGGLPRFLQNSPSNIVLSTRVTLSNDTIFAGTGSGMVILGTNLNPGAQANTNNLVTGPGALIKSNSWTLRIMGTPLLRTELVNGGTLTVVMNSIWRTNTLTIGSGAFAEFIVTNVTFGYYSTNAAGGTFQNFIGGSGTFIKSGSGTLELSVTAPRQGSIIAMGSGGLIDIQEGVLKSGTNTIWNASALTNIVVTPNSTITNIYNANRATVNIAAGAAFDVGDTATVVIDALTGAGNVLKSSAATPTTTIIIGTNNGSGLFTGNIANPSGALAINKVGTGIEVFTGTNTYSGVTTLTAGQLRLASETAASPNSTYTINVGNGLGFSNVNVITLGGLAGSGSGTLGMTNLADGTAVTLSVGANNATTTFSGKMYGEGASLIKVGSGLLILNGTNFYTGGTFINNGVLRFDRESAIPAYDSVTINYGGTLAATGAFNTVTDWLNSGYLTTNSMGTIAFYGNSEENLDFTSYTNIYLGTIGTNIYSGTITPGNAAYLLGGPGFLVITNDLALTGANALIIGGTAGGLVILTGSNDFSGGTVLNNSGLSILHEGQIGGVGASLAINGGTLQIRGLYLTNFNTLNVTLDQVGNGTFALEIQRPDNTFILENTFGTTMNLTKAGTGTLRLLASNDISGVVTVNGGVLDIRHSQALGTATGVVNVGGALELRDNITVNNILALAGSGIGSNGVVRNVSGDNTLAGPILLTGGSRINSDAGLLTISSLLSNGANAFIIGGFGDTHVSGTIAGSGALIKDGTGVLRLTGTNAYSGGTQVRNGTFIVDYSGYTEGVSNTIVRGQGALTLGGTGQRPTFIINGSDSFAVTQNFGGLTIGTGYSTLLVSNSSQSDFRVTLGGFTRAVGAGVLDIVLPDAGELRTTTATNFTGIFSSFVTINGQDWASTDTAASPFTIIPYGSYTDVGSAIPNQTNANIRISDISSATITLESTSNVVYTIMAKDSTGEHTVNLGSGNNLVLGNPGAILLTRDSATLTIGASPNDGLLSALGELVLINHSVGTSLVINAAISQGGNALTIAGIGPVILNGNNQYTGATYLNGPDVTFNGTNNLGGTFIVYSGNVTLGADSENRLRQVEVRDSGRLVLNGNANLGSNDLFVGTTSSGDRTVDRATFIINGNLDIVSSTTGGIISAVKTGRFYVGNVAGGAGAVIQNSGVVNVSTNIGSTDILNIGQAAGSAAVYGSGAYGTYRMNDGTLNVGELRIANGAGTMGVFEQYGGNVTVVAPLGNHGWLRFNIAANTHGILNLFGGTMVNATTNALIMGWGGTNMAAINVLGGTLDSGVTALELARTGVGVTSVVNLVSGTLIANQIQRSNTLAVGVLNFDGGTLQARAGITNENFLRGLSGVYIHAGGAIIDTAGSSVTIGDALQAPSGYGLGAIAVTDGGSGYIGAPIVRISGGSGIGASAIALVDYASGTVTGVLVTGIGSGYKPNDILDSMVVELIGGGATQPATLGAVTLVPTDSTGGLIKLGTGTLTFTNVNTYLGSTFISNGILQFATMSGTNEIFNLGGAGTLTQNGLAPLIVSSNSAGFIGNINVSTGVVVFTKDESVPYNANRLLIDAAGTVVFQEANNLDTVLTGVVDRASSGALALAPGTYTLNLDFASLGITNLTLGAFGEVHFAGTYTPVDNHYRLGGGGGMFIYSNALNTGTLDVGLAGGAVTTVRMAGGLGSNVFVNIKAAGALDLNGADQNLNFLSGSGFIFNNGTASTLTLGGGGGTTTYDGAIQGNISLQKIGAGTLVLGGSNSYNGVTLLTEGTIQLQQGIARAGLMEGHTNLNNYWLPSPLSFGTNTFDPRWANVSGTAGSYPPQWGSGTWPTNTTIGYNGYLYNNSGTNATWTFAINCDDASRLYIDGVQVLVSSGNATVKTNILLTPGEHLFELRLANGGGSGGANFNVYGTGVCFAFDPEGRNTNVASAYITVTGIGGALFSTQPSILSPLSPVALASGTMLDINGNAVTIGGLSDYNGGAGLVTNTAALPGLISIALPLGTNAVFSGVIGDDAGASAISLAVNGAGTQTFTAQQNFNGDLFVMGGQLNLAGGVNPISTNSGIYMVGGILDLGGGDQTTTNVVSFRGGILQNGTITSLNYYYDGQAGVVSANLAGPVSLVKTTIGTLFLSGDNTFTGDVILRAGLLSIAKSNSLGAGANLAFAGGSLQFSGTGVHPINHTVTNISTAVFDISDPNGTLVLSGNMAGLGGLTKLGDGTLTLGGVALITNGAVNIYRGALDITGAHIWLGANNVDSWYVRSSSVVNISGTFIDATRLRIGDTAGLTATVNQTDGLVILAGDYGVIVGASTAAGGIYNLYGGILSNMTRLTLGVVAQSLGIFNMTNGTLYVGGALEVGRQSGAAHSSTNYFIQSGGDVTAATLTMGRNNADSSNQVMYLILSNGTFTATAFNYLAPATNQMADLYFGNGANVSLPAFPTARGVDSVVNVTFDGVTLSAGGISSNYLGRVDNAYLTPNGLNFVIGAGTNVGIAQVLQDSGGAGVLRKFGEGTLILSNDNTFTGDVIVNDGTLQLGLGGPVGSVLDTAIDLPTATSFLAFNRSDVVTNWITITGNGGLVQKGPGTLVIVNTNTFSGDIVVNGGFLLFASTNVFRVSGNSLVLASGALGVMDMTNLNTYLLPYLPKDSAGMIALTDAARGESFDFNADNFTNLILGAGVGVITNSGYVPFTDGVTSYFRLGAASDATFVFTNVIGADGVVEINKGGTGGAVVLTRLNNYTNGATVFGGTLGVAHQRSLGTGLLTMYGGSALSNTVALNALTNAINLVSGRIAFITPANLTLVRTIYGSGGIDKYGQGFLMLTPSGTNNNYTGGTVLYEGGIAINNTNSMGSTARLSMYDGTVLSNTTAIASGSGVRNAMTLVSGVATMQVGPDLLISGAITMTGQLYKVGTGMLTLSAGNAGTGGVYVAQGGLGIGNVNALGGGILTLTDGTSLSNTTTLVTGAGVTNAILLESGTITFNVGGNRRLLVSGDITESGTATLVKSGYAELYLSGNNTFSGGIVINQGTVQFNNTNALPATGSITLNGGGVALDVADLASNLLPRLAPDPNGLLGLFLVNATEDFNFNTSNYANLGLAAAETLTYGGTYTPYQQDGTNYFRLGAFNGVTLTFTNQISGDAALEINKGQFTGTVFLPNTNNFNGAVVLNGGTVVIEAIRDAGVSGIGYGPLLSVTSNTLIRVTGTGAQSTSRTITNSGLLGLDLVNSGADLTLNGDYAGSGGIYKYGAGTLTLAGNVFITNAVVTTGFVYLNEGVMNIASSANIFWHGTNMNMDAWYVRSNTTLNIYGTMNIGRLRVGNISDQIATVNQFDGSLVTLRADFGVMLGNAAAGNLGVYNLFGGTLSNVNRLVMGLDVNSQGLFNMTNGFLWAGTLEVGRRDTNRNATNQFVQTGGTAITTNLYVGSLTNQWSYLILSNGNFTATKFTHFGGSVTNVGVNTVSSIYIGPGAYVSLPNFPETRGDGSLAEITIDGGTLSAGYITGALANNYLGRTDNAFITGNGANFVVGEGTNVFITHVLQETGPAAIRKFGNGLLVLSNDAPHTGGSFIHEGVLAFGSSNIASHVTVYTNATIGVGFSGVQAFLATQVTAHVDISVALTELNQNEDIDFTALQFTNAFLGALGNVVYGGLLTPFDTSYRFGGGSGVLTYGGVIGGNSNVIIGGGQPITVIFTATNTYTGPTFLNKGTLSVASLADENGNIPTNGMLNFSGGALQYTGAGDTTTRLITNMAGATIEVADGSATLVLNTDVAGDGGFAKSGPGTLTFGVAQHFYGGLTLNGGFLQLASGDDPIPSDNFIVVNGGILDIGGGTQNTTNYVLFTGGNIQVQNGTIDSANFDFQTVGGTISANLAGPVGLIKSGTNVLLLSGNNTFTGPVVVNAGLLAIDNASALGSGSKMITNAAVIRFDNPMSVPDDKTMVMVVGTNLVPLSGAGSVWNGAMILTPGTNTFNITTNGLGTLTPDFTVMGLVSGNGAILKLGPGMLELFGTNIYSGGTRINAGTLSVRTIHAIDSGTLAFGGGNFRYTGDGVEASGLTITNISAPVYDIADLNGSLVLHGDIRGAALALTKAGPGSLVFSNNAFTTAGVTVREGALVFFDTALTNTAIINVGTLSGRIGSFVLAGSTILTNASELRVGTLAGANGVLMFMDNPTYTGLGLIQVGQAAGSTGRFYMTDGSLNTTGMIYLGGANGAIGAMYQTGGDVRAYEIRASQTAGGYGFYQFSGGTATVSNWTRIASGGLGLMYVTGGDYLSNTSTNLGLMMAGNGGGAASTGVYYQTGGNVQVGQFRMGNVRTNENQLTIAGGTLTVDGTLFIQYELGTNIINLLGGTLQVGEINRRVTGGGLHNINFDGGTLRAGNDGVVILGGGNRLSGAYVYSGGAIIDTDGKNVEIVQNLIAPTGNGVSSITLGAPLTGYIGAPYVAINGGGGTGATAVALFDYTSGSVTGILVTSRGYNYGSAPTVTLIGGGQDSVALSASIDANTSGGLTKRGDGTLLLSGTNTYAGYTRIEAGTLALNYGTILTNSAGFHVLSGGVLDAQAYAPPLSSQSGLTLWPHQVLRGAGTVVGDVNLGNTVGLGGGTIIPGDSIGTLTIDGSLDLGEGAGSVLLVYELQSPSNSDRIIISNGLSFASMSTNWFHFIAGGDLQVGNYVLMSALAGYGWSTLDENGDYGGTNFPMIGTSGKSGYLWLNENGQDVMLTVVPEPGTGMLVATGLLALYFLGRRKRARA